MKKTYNNALTKEEMEKIESAVNNIGEYGTVEIIKNGNTIDVIQSQRDRIRNGYYNKG